MPNESSKNSQRYSTNISTADSDLHAPIMDSPMGDFPYDFAGEFEQIIGQHDEKENCVNPSNTSRVEDTASSSSSLTFQLLMNDRDQGVTISITQLRVASLRQLLTESGFFRMEASRFCTLLISYSDKASGALSKDQYDNAMRRIVLEIGVTMSPETQQRLSDLLTSLFFAFDREKRAKVDAIECEFVACFSFSVSLGIPQNSHHMYYIFLLAFFGFSCRRNDCPMWRSKE